jgi:hypothetical protein
MINLKNGRNYTGGGHGFQCYAMNMPKKIKGKKLRDGSG